MLKSPSELHPAFFGCYDWHSSVHGHWMLVKLLKEFPDIKERDEIIGRITETLTRPYGIAAMTEMPVISPFRVFIPI